MEIVSTELTLVSKDFVVEVSVNRAHKVNKGKLVVTKLTRSPKDFAEFAVLTEHLLVNT